MCIVYLTCFPKSKTIVDRYMKKKRKRKINLLVHDIILVTDIVDISWELCTSCTSWFLPYFLLEWPFLDFVLLLTLLLLLLLMMLLTMLQTIAVVAVISLEITTLYIHYIIFSKFLLDYLFCTFLSKVILICIAKLYHEEVTWGRSSTPQLKDDEDDDYVIILLILDVFRTIFCFPIFFLFFFYYVMSCLILSSLVCFTLLPYVIKRA